MKSRILPAIAVFSLLTMPALAAQRADVRIDLAAQGEKVDPGFLNGTCLPIWNTRRTYQDIQPGLAQAKFSLLRFPNGSLSNDYHWNGKGSYNAESVWVCDTTEYQPGFVVQTLRRGTSKSHYGFEGASCITDGDTATFWRSDPLTEETAPWFFLELPTAQPVDSVTIVWGGSYGKDFKVQFWPGGAPFYPGPFSTFSNRWVDAKAVLGNQESVSRLRLDSTEAACYWRVLIAGSSARGVAVREVYLYSKGSPVSVNKKQYGTGGQTKVTAIGAHPASKPRADFSSGWVDWDFESFMTYSRSFPYATRPIVCVNYGTGTPHEAAAWVRYANKVKQYGIRYWQVGNEMDGDWEEGGPVSAKMYAEKFVKFARAMKDVDSSILVFGPVTSSADFAGRASGDYNDTSWMETFLAYVGTKEREDNRKYCDGVDFHSYPYWFSARPQEGAMLQSADYVYDRSDRLKEMMGRHLVDSDSTLVLMSEYNSSVQMSSMLHKPVNAIVLSVMYGGLLEKFGSRAGTVVWDSYEGGSVGPDGTHGSLSLFNAANDNLFTSLGKPPSAAWWASYLSNALVMDSDGENRLMPLTYDRSTRLRAYAVRTSDGVRVMMINAGYDTLESGISFDGTGTFPLVDVASWNGRLFDWHSGPARELAMPNCGPVSRRLTAAGMGPVVLPPLSIAVVAYRGASAGAKELRCVHLGAWPLTARYGDTVRVWASLSGNAGIASFRYAIDDTVASRAVVSLDGGNDGPHESFFFGFRADSLAPGPRRVVLWALDSAGNRWSDTVEIRVTGLLRPVQVIDDFEDRDLLSSLPGTPAWRRYANGANGSTIDVSIDTSLASPALKAAFNIIQPSDLSYDNFAKFDVILDSGFMAANGSRFKGVRFRYATSHTAASGAFFVQAMSRKVKDYGDFNVKLENTNGVWKTVTLPWRSFTQYDWAAKVGTLEAADIRDLEFRITKAGQGNFLIDDLYFIDDEGDSVAVDPRHLHRAKAGAWGPIPHTRGGATDFVWDPALSARSLTIHTLSGRKVVAIDLTPGASAYRWNHRTRGVAGAYVVQLHHSSGTLERVFTLP